MGEECLPVELAYLLTASSVELIAGENQVGFVRAGTRPAPVSRFARSRSLFTSGEGAWP